MSEWQDSGTREVSTLQLCGTLTLQISRRCRYAASNDLCPANWAVLHDDEDAGDVCLACGVLDVAIDPTLDELKRLAVDGAARWLDGLKAKLPRSV